MIDVKEVYRNNMSAVKDADNLPFFVGVYHGLVRDSESDDLKIMTEEDFVKAYSDVTFDSAKPYGNIKEFLEEWGLDEKSDEVCTVIRNKCLKDTYVFAENLSKLDSTEDISDFLVHHSKGWEIVRLSDYSIVFKKKIEDDNCEFRVQITKGLENHITVKRIEL